MSARPRNHALIVGTVVAAVAWLCGVGCGALHGDLPLASGEYSIELTDWECTGEMLLAQDDDGTISGAGDICGLVVEVVPKYSKQRINKADLHFEAKGSVPMRVQGAKIAVDGDLDGELSWAGYRTHFLATRLNGKQGKTGADEGSGLDGGVR